MSDFERRAFFDDERLVGARWWQEHLAAAVGRRDSLRMLSYLAVSLLGVGAAARLVEACAMRKPGGTAATTTDDDLHVTKDAIDLQRLDGWDVGRPGERLTWSPAASSVDVDGKAPDADAFTSLVEELTPADPRYGPYYVPTLLQWPASLPADERATIQPMHTTEMEQAFAQGHALATLFKDLPKETAVIVDMPGPLAVAFAAGMAATFEPVWTFDNWPHPVGVVPSHLTLASLLFYRPLLKHAKTDRAHAAPPVFVLDASRLTSYADAATQFDNRYLAKLPPVDGWKGLGVKHVLYVTDGAYKELDDLNDDFVALKAAGLTPKLVDRADFKEASGADAQRIAIGDLDAGATSNPGYTYAPRPIYYVPTYYYGGYPGTHFWFWHSYGWYSPPAYRTARPPTFVSPGLAYDPSPRPTIFAGSSSGTGRTRPAGFGRVSVTTSRSTGHVTSTPYGGRSGSFGRSGSGGGGGYGGGGSG